MDGTGPANPRQLEKYVANQCFWKYELPHEALYYKHCNKAYLEIAQRFGFIDRAEQIVLQLYCEPLQKFRLAAQGHGAVQPPDRLRARVAAAFDPLRPGMRRSPRRRRRRPSSRCTRSPSGRWRCTIPGARTTRGCARSSASTAST